MKYQPHQDHSQPLSNKTSSLTKGGRVIGKIILATLAMGGIVMVGAVAPGLLKMVKDFTKLRNIAWVNGSEDKRKQHKKLLDSFTYLRRRGLIKMGYQGRQLYISLTPEGRKKAKRLNIDSLHIERTRTWDKRWRIIMFDVEEERKATREALRGKLKELGFYPMQKSVWLHAFPCEKELAVLQQFFGIDESAYVCLEIKGLPKTIERKAKIFFQV